MRILKAFVLGSFIIGAVVLLASVKHPQVAAAAGHGTPSAGFTIHIDAQKHFPNHPAEWAHHWCRAAAGVPGMLECQIYGSDDANAALVATEVIVPTAAWKKMDSKEQAYWHYHKTEIPKVNAKMPDISPAAAKKMVAGMMETYGKIYILWDPMDGKPAAGAPSINNLEGNQK